MRLLKYLVAATLDGKIAAPDGSFDCFGPVGDAHVPDYLAAIHEFDAVLMGRRTYEVALTAGVTDPYPFLDSYVFTSSTQLERERTSSFRARAGGGLGARVQATDWWSHLLVRRSQTRGGAAGGRIDRRNYRETESSADRRWVSVVRFGSGTVVA